MHLYHFYVKIRQHYRKRRGKKNNEEQGTLFNEQGDPNIQETKDEIKDEQEKVANNAPSELNNNSPVEGEQSELDLSALGEQSIEAALGIDEFIPESDDNETNTFYIKHKQSHKLELILLLYI